MLSEPLPGVSRSWDSFQIEGDDAVRSEQAGLVASGQHKIKAATHLESVTVTNNY